MTIVKITFLMLSIIGSINAKNKKKRAHLEEVQSEINEKKCKKLSWDQIIQNSQKAIIYIFKYSANFNWLEPYKTPHQTGSSGTGFFINDQGYIITNFHVIDQAAILYAQVPHLGKQRFNVEIIAVSPERDIALLRLSKESYNDYIKLSEKIEYLTFGSSDSVLRAHEVATLGFPLGQEFLKSTTGSVSGVQILNEKNFIQIDAPINPGNSGGPALDIMGFVIGVNTCVINANGTQNVGYIIPIKEVQIFLNEVEKLHLMPLQENALVQKTAIIRNPVIGVSMHGSTKSIIEYCENPMPGGPYLIEIIKDSLGDKIGLQKGDMIYNINGIEVDRFGDINSPWTNDKIAIGQYLCQLDIDTPIKLIVYRNGKELNLEFPWINTHLFPIRYMYPPHEKIDYIVISGMVLMPLTINHLVVLQKTPYFHHLEKYDEMKNMGQAKLIISHILPNSLAEKARFMHPGMIVEKINGIEVGTIEECNKALLKSVENNFLTVLIESGEFFVGNLNDILKEEAFLSQFYYYPISDIVKQLLNFVNK